MPNISVFTNSPIQKKTARDMKMGDIALITEVNISYKSWAGNIVMRTGSDQFTFLQNGFSVSCNIFYNIVEEVKVLRPGETISITVVENPT